MDFRSHAASPSTDTCGQPLGTDPARGRKRAEDKLRDEIARLEMKLERLKLKQARLYGQAHFDRVGQKLEEGDLCIVDGAMSFSPFKDRIVRFVRVQGDGRLVVQYEGEVRSVSSTSLRRLSTDEIATFINESDLARHEPVDRYRATG